MVAWIFPNSSTAQFRSIYDLIDAKVEIEINGGLVTLTSPWTSDPGSLLESMPILESKLTVMNDEFIDGRININQAPKEILMAMPDITEKIADDIIAARPPIEAGGMSAAMMATRVSPAWLLAEGWVDLPTFKRLGPWLTNRRRRLFVSGTRSFRRRWPDDSSGSHD